MLSAYAADPIRRLAVIHFDILRILKISKYVNSYMKNWPSGEWRKFSRFKKSDDGKLVMPDSGARREDLAWALEQI
jgi:hypothetical protein